MRFVITSHLTPRDTVKAFQKRGYTPILLPPHPNLPTPIASHADTLLFFAPDAVYTTPLYAKIAKSELSEIASATGHPIRTTRQELGNQYPMDILLNAAPIGNRLFCLKAHTAQEILEAYKDTVCPIRQGYAKCSILPVSQNALISADPSVLTSAQTNGISALKITAGEILLRGYDTGFIGGTASFAPYENAKEIFFCGKLSSHTDGFAMEAFCKANGKTPISLGEFPLTDVGTMFLI